MIRFACAIGFVTLLSANARAADPDWSALPRPEAVEERVSLTVSQRSGLVEAPFVTAAFPEVSGFGSVLIGTAGVGLPPLGWLRVRLPISWVRIDFPARAQVSEAALGNLELGLDHELALLPSTRVGLLVSALTPSAAHGPSTSLLNHRVLALCSALNGGKDGALLTPGVIGQRLGARLDHSRGLGSDHHGSERRRASRASPRSAPPRARERGRADASKHWPPRTQSPRRRRDLCR